MELWREQMKTNYIAGCLVVFVVGAELCESKEMRFPDHRTLSVEPRNASTLSWNPHTHFERDTEVRATTVAPFSVSGGQRAEEMFRLFIYPAASGFRLVGQPISPEPDGSPSQSMYGFCPTVESLAEMLTWELPSSQIDVIRRTAIAGNIQEIGGSRSSVIRFLRRSQLENIGLTFRPID
jgi:hypothetical protein